MCTIIALNSLSDSSWLIQRFPTSFLSNSSKPTPGVTRFVTCFKIHILDKNTRFCPLFFLESKREFGQGWAVCCCSIRTRFLMEPVWDTFLRQHCSCEVVFNTPDIKVTAAVEVVNAEVLSSPPHSLVSYSAALHRNKTTLQFTKLRHICHLARVATVFTHRTV